MPHESRIDKFLWEIRLFKTRTLAAEACKKGHVFINGLVAKPSRNVIVGNDLQLKKGPVKFCFRILALPNGRVNAKLVELYVENRTDSEQLEILRLANINNGFRQKGTGRPTKKERRDLLCFTEEYSFFDENNQTDEY